MYLSVSTNVTNSEFKTETNTGIITFSVSNSARPPPVMHVRTERQRRDSHAIKYVGKASVTGYCIRFKTLKVINTEALKAAVACGFENQNDAAV